MLTIRPEQTVALREPARIEFEKEMAQHLRAHFPERMSARSDGELETQARESVDRALERGLSAKQDLCRFLNLEAVLGQSWVLEAWEQTLKGTPSAKLAHLQKRAAFELEAQE